MRSTRKRKNKSGGNGYNRRGGSLTVEELMKSLREDVVKPMVQKNARAEKKLKSEKQTKVRGSRLNPKRKQTRHSNKIQSNIETQLKQINQRLEVIAREQDKLHKKFGLTKTIKKNPNKKFPSMSAINEALDLD